MHLVQVFRSRGPDKRESGALRRFGGKTIPELPPQLSAASPSLTCHWALRCKAWEGREGRRPASQETCLNDVILPACGARVRGGLPLWWQRALSHARRPPWLDSDGF